MKADSVHRLIGQAQRREFFARALFAATYTLPIAAALAALRLLGRSLGLAAGAAGVWCAAIAGSAVAAIAAFAAVGVSTRRLARLLDQRAGVKDRLTIALDFAARARRSPLMELAIADAEAAALRLQPAAWIPLWSREHARRLATLLLILPFVYAAAVIDLAARRQSPGPQAAAAAAPDVIPELAADGFRELPRAGVLQPVRANLRGLIGDWRTRLTELREKARAAAPFVEPALPATIYREAPRGAAPAPPILGPDGLPLVRNTDRLHPSDVRALGDVDPTVESAMRTAFSQLDEQLLDEDPQLAALAMYAVKLNAMSDPSRLAGVELAAPPGGWAGNNLASLAARAGASLPAAPATKSAPSNALKPLNPSAMFNGPKNTQPLNGPKPDADPLKSWHGKSTPPASSDHQQTFRQNQASAQDQSFSEFMQQYAAHLARLVAAKEDVLNERAAKTDPNQAPKTLAADQGQELPPDTQMRLVQPTQDMLRGLKLTNDLGGQLTLGDGRGAGQGGGTPHGAIKVKHEEQAAPGPRDALPGQVGEGRAPVQILEDADNGPAAPLAAMMRAFQADAAERLQDASIPLDIRVYVQRYLQAAAAAALEK